MTAQHSNNINSGLEPEGQLQLVVSRVQRMYFVNQARFANTSAEFQQAVALRKTG